MADINLVIGFNLGLLSTPHCLAMCGGIITALSMAGAGVNDIKAGRRTGLVIAYNLGRITSYTIAGAIAGLAGKHIAYTIMPSAGHSILKIIAAVMLVLIGLQLGGWLPGLRQIEALGFKFWRMIQPLAGHFTPVTGWYGALMTGVIWGWLPCGLVYSVLLWSLSSGDAPAGALLMFMFGLGTLPGMITTGVLGNELFSLLRQRSLRTTGGLIIILLGILSLLFHPAHHQH